ncbi:MAG: PhnD/SsuA/transferrin family substrate-binding protein [Polyangiaceae bacterium]|jgi:ABC-type phosphate/phosphonate transport system substrate-binding protein|nr:PhnD/SsuA/transferrin family substrate-binding protein [Polyangiaceae bacterium]MBK8943077.1 PhnD/SsuA/transferrin family substrate-binding protein [Polyangiaceae bacterium]
MRRRLFPVALASLTALTVVSGSHAGTEVKLVVLKEKGVGTTAQAQPFVDKFMAIATKKNGWSSGKASFFTERKPAEASMDADKPQFAILSLPAYLAMKDARKLETIGQVIVSRAGGQEYHIVSKSASDLGGCRGSKLATDHADDKKFIDRVVSGGAWKLAEFHLETTKRPLQAMKMVIKDEAKCALIDDAQLAEMKSMEGGKDLKSVWKSAKLPGMAVVALPSADKATKEGFKNSLATLCDGDGKTVCGEIGIQSLKAASDDAYGQILAAYKKDK